MRFIQVFGQRAVEGALLFACAGTWRFRGGWIYVMSAVALTLANAVYILPRNPEIIVERGKRHEGTAGFDKVVIAFYAAFYVALLVVAGLDARFGWSQLAPAWAIVGFGLMALGMIPTAGAMAVNRNLEPTVRIQTDRGHTVTTTGPYRWVRHPMYVGLLLAMPGGALMLGSGWALAPAAAGLIALVVRTALEDRTLRRDLPGYEDYAAHTRWRLLPGVW